MLKNMAQLMPSNDALLLVGEMRVDGYVPNAVHNRGEAAQARVSYWAERQSAQKGHGYHIGESIFVYHQRFEVVSFFHQLFGRSSGTVALIILPIFLRCELLPCHFLGIHKDSLHFNGKRFLVLF